MIRFTALPRALLTLALASLAAAAPATRGSLVLIGGGSKPPPILRHFVALAGGPQASIVVLPTASGLPDTGSYYEELFAEATGATNVRALALKTRADAFRPEFVSALREADGVFFSGGDQSRITDALLGTPALRALAQAHARGAVLGGTSAGTACMSSPMLTGEGDLSLVKAGNIETAPGLGFFSGVIVDQHFLARRRQNRLLSLVLEHPARLGIGVDEATAVWVRPDGTLRVLGEAGVLIYDASRAQVTRQGDALGVAGLTAHLLLAGQGFDLERRVVLPRE